MNVKVNWERVDSKSEYSKCFCDVCLLINCRVLLLVNIVSKSTFPRADLIFQIIMCVQLIYSRCYGYGYIKISLYLLAYNSLRRKMYF